MATMDVTLPDGTVLQGIPEGTTKEQIAAKLKASGRDVPDSWMAPAKSRHSPGYLKMSKEQQQLMDSLGTPEGRQAYETAQQKKVVDAMPWYERLSAGAGKAVVDTGRGIGQLIGKVSQEDVARAREKDQPLMDTASGRVGNVLGYVGEALPAALIAPAAGVGAGAALGTKAAIGGALGGAQGYAQPYASTGEHVANTLVGTGLGAVLPGMGAAAGKVVNGLATPEARALAAEGVKLTPGMMLGGAAKRTEDMLTSIPIVGGAIRKAQARALESFDNAAINRVIAPLGTSLPKGVAGRQALGIAQDAVSKAYDTTLSQMKGRVDQKLATDIGSLWNKYGKNLPAKEGDELGSYIQNDVLRKFDQSGQAPGKIVHEIQSDLGAQAAKLMRSDDLGRRQLGQAVKDLQGHVKDMLKRNNAPDLNNKLQAATNSFRQLVRVNKAAGMIGAHDGVFTPAQLRSAVRATDSTRNKAAFTQGRAEMQDLAEKAQGVLPSKVPDSGTAGRLMMDASVLGGGAATGHILPVLGAGAIAHGVYSAPGQAILQRAFMPRQNPVSNYLAHLAQTRLSNPANALMAPGFTNSLQPSPVPQQ